MPRLWPFSYLPRLGDPSEPSLAPQTAEPLAPIPPTLHPTLPRNAPEPHRSTLDPDRGYYGEAPMGLWRYERAVGDAVPPHSIENSEEPLGAAPVSGLASLHLAG